MLGPPWVTNMLHQILRTQEAKCHVACSHLSIPLNANCLGITGAFRAFTCDLTTGQFKAYLSIAVKSVHRRRKEKTILRLEHSCMDYRQDK